MVWSGTLQESCYQPRERRAFPNLHTAVWSTSLLPPPSSLLQRAEAVLCSVPVIEHLPPGEKWRVVPVVYFLNV